MNIDPLNLNRDDIFNVPRFADPKIISAVISSVPMGAVLGGLSGGIIGRACCSFFNAQLASTVGGFAMFAGVGALAAPLTVISKLLIDHLLKDNKFCQQHTIFSDFICRIATNLLQLGSITAAAVILGTPIAATIVCMMIVPAVITILTTLYDSINALLNNNLSCAV